MTFKQLMETHPELWAFFPYGLPSASEYSYDDDSSLTVKTTDEVDECIRVILPRFFKRFPDSDMNLLKDGGACVTWSAIRKDWPLFGLFFCFCYYQRTYENNNNHNFAVETSCQWHLENMLQAEELVFSREAILMFADYVLEYEGELIRQLLHET